MSIVKKYINFLQKSRFSHQKRKSFILSFTLQIMDNVTGAASNLSSMTLPVITWVPEKYQLITTLAIYIVIIAIYAFFVWKFYKLLARRDIFSLNLSKYSDSKNPESRKSFAILLYILEHFLVLPVIIFFWFGILAMLLLLLSGSQSVAQILIIAAAVVGATRLTSYMSEELSVDMAKMFPFTLLGVFLLNPNFFSFPELIGRIHSIPSFLEQIVLYIGVIFAIEIVIRGAYEFVKIIKGKKVVTTSKPDKISRKDKERIIDV
jgi:hypothetical protein